MYRAIFFLLQMDVLKAWGPQSAQNLHGTHACFAYIRVAETFGRFICPIIRRTELRLETPSDMELLELVRCGDESGFRQLHTRYSGRIRRYGTRLLNDRDRADDIVQNVFVKLLTSAAAIRNGQSVRSWLFACARNEAFNELARRKMDEADDSIVSDGKSPEELMMIKQRDEIVEDAVSRLRLCFREAIMLRVYEQMSYEEIAAVTQSSVSSVKARLFKARKALIQMLHPLWEASAHDI